MTDNNWTQIETQLLGSLTLLIELSSLTWKNKNYTIILLLLTVVLLTTT